MSSDLPSVDDLKRAAESGQRITPEDVSVIGQMESELTGGGPIHGGPSGMYLTPALTNQERFTCEIDMTVLATAQSLAMRQMNFEAKLDELSQKPPSHITREDAREIQEMEVRFPPSHFKIDFINWDSGPCLQSTSRSWIYLCTSQVARRQE
jgi:hypothetical protein